MLAENDLDEAVRRGIISADQRLALIDLGARDSKPTARVSVDENLRLVGGGNDLFVTAGLVMVLSGLLFVLNSVMPVEGVIQPLIVMAAIWALAEIVTRQKRMRLSSTVLALGFFVAAGVLTATLVKDRLPDPETLNIWQAMANRGSFAAIIAGGGFAVAAAAALYFYRFRVPVLAAAIALSLTWTAFTGLAYFLAEATIRGDIAAPSAEMLPEVLNQALIVPVFAGLLIFIAGVLLDLSDRERETIRSDSAFWLHVVSAPMIVHPLFMLATGQTLLADDATQQSGGAGIALAALIAGFTFIALAIDRRSLLVPALGYFGLIGVYSLIEGAADATGIPPLALVLLATGGTVIMFGAGWQTIRRLIIRPVLPKSVLNRLPPIKA